MKIREFTGQNWLRWLDVRALTIYPFVFYRAATPSKTLRNHEAIHIAQVRRDGWLRFYTRYLWEYLRGRWRGLAHKEAYRAIGYEAEAYAHQDDPGYPARLATRNIA